MSLFDPQTESDLLATKDTPSGGAPLAERMRPRDTDSFIGQPKIMGPDGPLLRAIKTDTVGSIIFWGPPGSGKTTLARIIAKATAGQFVSFSAVVASIKEVKALLADSGKYRRATGKKTYVFIDEIHRFNKAQQDAFLPYMESGDIVLLGATTENPSFEINSALLSRCRVYVLERLSAENLQEIIKQALSDKESGFGEINVSLTDEALEFLANASDGDARRALGLLETTVIDLQTDSDGNSDKTEILVTLERLQSVHQKNISLYDKSGEEHFNIISALHKTIRGGDPDAALYWLARMISGGEPPMYILRRLIRFASEDIGLADPNALLLAIAARDSYHMLGSPEGELAIAELVIYLACAPKSNSAYTAWKAALKLAESSGSLPAPLDIRNAPTKLMKNLGYGKEYKYAHEFAEGITDQEYFPTELAGTELYQPKASGRETKIADYIKEYRKRRAELMKSKSESLKSETANSEQKDR